MKKFLAAVLLLAAGAATAGPVELIKNGSFEKNGVNANTWTIMSALDGWTVGPNGAEVRNNIAGAAKDGNNYLELDSTANSWISQSFNTISGAQYNLSFFYAPREHTAASTNGIDVFWNGNLLKHVAEDNFTSLTQWQKIDLSMFAIGNLSTLQFKASGISDGYGGSLDNVSMSVKVPEPGTLASILLGLGMLGFTLRRRQK
ncbi:PEP-CTERM sorting domain-containing protein [Pseudoduganella violaceinigra]|uniref:PEP-CTERM sorting domain-containing protein n=1 Tax=Pseudoduganella violaceinigra TaxID=246602 RepID=UPI000412396F|nr:PEP-CTERM sorting domain-containing protein [Pseudoduganella violaceinigra]